MSVPVIGGRSRLAVGCPLGPCRLNRSTQHRRLISPGGRCEANRLRRSALGVLHGRRHVCCNLKNSMSEECQEGTHAPQQLSFIRWPRWPGQTVSVAQWGRALAVLRLINSWNRGRRGLRLDQIRGHKRRDRGGIFLQSLETKMHIVIPIEPLGVRSGPLLHCLSGIEEKKVVGDAHFLHRRADEIVPHAAGSVRFQVLQMRVIDE
jgi:hypothetical protein